MSDFHPTETGAGRFAGGGPSALSADEHAGSELRRQRPAPLDWRRVAARMQRELDRADLGDRATRLARVLVSLTLAERRVEVLLTDRAELCRLLGIGENHIGGVFDLLAASGIASCARGSEGWLVRVFSDSASWRCEWHFEREALCAYLSGVNHAPGQVQGELFEPEPDLQRAKAEVDAEAASAAADFPKREVPKKGSQGVPIESNRTNRAEEVLDSIRSNRIEGGAGLWSDGYVLEKLARVPSLHRELQQGRTPTARRFVELHQIKPDRAHSLLAQAVQMRCPGAWLNRVLENEAKMKSTARHVHAAQVVHDDDDGESSNPARTEKD